MIQGEEKMHINLMQCQVGTVLYCPFMLILPPEVQCNCTRVYII